MDIVKDYTSETIKLTPDCGGEVTATLVSSKFNLGNRKSVLYLHGYVDYFFQAHLGRNSIQIILIFMHSISGNMDGHC